KSNLEQLFREKGSEPITITYIPRGPNDSSEYTSSSGIVYTFNLPYVGRYDIRGKTYSGGFVVGEKGGGYLLTFYVEATPPSVENDEILKEEGPTKAEREKIKSYFEGTLSEQDLLGNARSHLYVKNPTFNARAVRWLHILLEESLQAEVSGRVPWLA